MPAALWSRFDATAPGMQRLSRAPPPPCLRIPAPEHHSCGAACCRRPQVATLRESNADYRKFYVHSGTSALTLRAESKEDRWVWMQALQTWWVGGDVGGARAALRAAPSRPAHTMAARQSPRGRLPCWPHRWHPARLSPRRSRRLSCRACCACKPALSAPPLPSTHTHTRAARAPGRA